MPTKTKRVLADFHHAGLLHSLIMLFEGRLDYKLYRPIGTEWHEQGYWAVYDHPATVQQYLTTAQGYKPADGSKPLNKVLRAEKETYYCQDIDSGYYNKAITLKRFSEIKFDLVIASLPQHIEPFKKLIANHQPWAKLIFQVGNQWDGIHADNIMASARLARVPEGINAVEYHQEFDISLFNPVDRAFENRSIVSLMNSPDGFPDYGLLLEIERRLKDRRWKVNIHGGQGRDGAVHGAKNVASVLRFSKFLWHVKAGGDGYGHILFNSAACGVPAIVKKSYYAGKLGEKLLIDGVTCIDIDGLAPAEIVEHILHFSQPENYSKMSQAIYDNFRDCVDFDKDEENIRQFLARLK